MKRIIRDRLPMLLAPLIVCVAYFLGAKLGFALKLHPYPISTMWPPNSILLAALLLAPTRMWWILLLAALPAHVAIQLANGVPVPMLLGWVVSNCSEALLRRALRRRRPHRAPAVRRLAPRRPLRARQHPRGDPVVLPRRGLRHARRLGRRDILGPLDLALLLEPARRADAGADDRRVGSDRPRGPAPSLARAPRRARGADDRAP